MTSVAPTGEGVQRELLAELNAPGCFRHAAVRNLMPGNSTHCGYTVAYRTLLQGIASKVDSVRYLWRNRCSTRISRPSVRDPNHRFGKANASTEDMMKARTIGIDSQRPPTPLATRRVAAAALLAACLLGGCSVRNMAANTLGDALASSGSGFGSDNDPELIGAAAPFSLKLMESVLAETPRHRGLLLAATQGFVQYSYAFVELRADEIEDTNLEEAYRQRDRARLLYLRARDYGLRALEVAYPGIDKALRKDPATALSRARVQDVPTLYWTGVAWAAAVSQSKDDPFLVSELPIAEALLRRALALDEAYDHGAIHVFLMSFEMSQAGLSAGAVERARHHFARAIELTGGRQAGPYVTYAESISIAERNRGEFEEQLRLAIEVDADAVPEWRLANRVMQRRAQWLQSRTDWLFAE